MRRILALLPVFLAFQVGVSPALAWTWPVGGPVLRPFAFDRDNPYAGGQHRGVDIGAPRGSPVVAPASGTVTFAGNVPGGGLTLAVRTADGYSVTLVHLGATAVARGETVSEGAAVGVVGPSGEAELGAPHVHLGVRIAADEQGYVDPLALLPPRGGSPPAEPAPGEGSAAPDGGKEAAPETDAPPVPGDGGLAGSAAVAEPAGAAGKRAAPKLARDPARSVQREPALYGERPAAHARAPSLPGLHVRVEAERPPRSAHALPVSAEVPGSRAWGAALALTAGLLACAGVAGCALALVARGKVRDAGRADGAAPVFAERAPVATEDAGCRRPGQQDDVFLHGDLERILLAQTQTFPDLDRNDNPAELVQVSDDSRRFALGLCGRGPHGCSRSHRRWRMPSRRPSLR